MPDAAPTLGEVIRRLDTVQDTLNQVVTVQHLELALKPSTQRIDDLADDINELTRALHSEREERSIEDEKLRLEILAERNARQNGNKWAIGIGLTILMVILGYLGFVVDAMGGVT